MDIRSKIHLVLRHDSVLGRGGKIIDANVTQIDLHDFCRLSTTYGLGGFHCVTEMEAQHRICSEILDYWHEGPGKTYNPDRVSALGLLKLHRSFHELETQMEGENPLWIGTSANESDKKIDFSELSDIIERSGRSAVIQFGTSWGLSPEQMSRCDWVLPPIDGHNGYNHLSVRCAAAIIVDRLLRQ